MKPFRIQMDFVCVAPDLERVETLCDRLMDLADGMNVRPEGGFVGVIPDSEVVDGSWLAERLEESW